MALAEDEIARLRSQHGIVALVSFKESSFAPAAEVVVKMPPRGEYKRYRAMLFDDSQRPMALETLARACTVYPDKEALDRMEMERPAMWERVGNRVTELAGGDDDVSVKKL